MPPANAAAIATAGILMSLFATSPAFRCGTSVGKDQTVEFPKPHNDVRAPFPSAPSSPNPSKPPNPSPAWMDHTKDKQSPARPTSPAAPPYPRPARIAADPTPPNPAAP